MTTKTMAQSLLSHTHTHRHHHHHLPGSVALSSPRRHLPFFQFPAAPLGLAKTSVSKLVLHRSTAVLRATPPSGADVGKPSEAASADQTNPKVSPQPAGGPGLPLPNIPIWVRWVLGTIFCLAIPFYRKILKVGEEVETTVEAVAEVVEEVAKATKKVAEGISEALPEGGGLKKVVLEVEEIAEEVIADAEQAKSFIHQVEEIREEVESLAEPIINAAIEIEKEVKENEDEVM